MGKIIAGVMGWPIDHSRSPALHGFWLERHGIDGAYLPFAVTPDRLRQALQSLPALGIAGVNLTVPHKEAAARIVDRLDRVAARTRSVNMVTVGPSGELEGHSTDGYGFLASLDEAVPGWHRQPPAALLIGGGGAARAIADALLDRGVANLTIANRTADRAKALHAALKRHHRTELATIGWDELAAATATAELVVNATTLGMAGQPALKLDASVLRPGSIVADIVYTPLETPLLAAARSRGCRVVDGLGMLIHQARPAFRRWFGVMPEADAASREAVLATLSG